MTREAQSIELWGGDRLEFVRLLLSEFNARHEPLADQLPGQEVKGNPPYEVTGRKLTKGQFFFRATLVFLVTDYYRGLHRVEKYYHQPSPLAQTSIPRW